MASKQLAVKVTDKHVLTHAEWNGMPEYFSRGSNETGIRDIGQDGSCISGSFRLIQHGWHDWKQAGDFIERCLAKDWDTFRISKLMDYLKERYTK